MAEESIDRMRAATISAVAAGISAIAAVVALIVATSFNARNDSRADRQDERSAQQEQRLDSQEQRQARQEEQQYASNVYIGEAPQYFYDEFGGRPAVGEIVWVVVNGSRTQLWDVWIEGRNDTSINIDGIQRCTLYSTQVAFEPIGVHFKDPNGEWYRPVDGPPSHEYRPMPG